MAMTSALTAHFALTGSGDLLAHFSMAPPAGVFFAGKVKKITKKTTC